tara:strand:- start:2231 stop:2941 length:711 start_codon:yes stop_codon:yes gene_type:complete
VANPKKSAPQKKITFLIQKGMKRYKTRIKLGKMPIDSSFFRSILFSFSAIFVFTLGFTDATTAQNEVGWWKGLFNGTQKSACDSAAMEQVAPTSSEVLIWEKSAPVDSSSDTVNSELSLAADDRPVGIFIEQYDKRIATLDSAWHTHEHALRGFRIQIFSGSLQAAREIRAKARKTTGEWPVYLSSMPPNYRVTIGDYRTRWEAQKAKDAWASSFPKAIVIPMNIKLPALGAAATD